MTKENSNRIKDGLEEALRHEKGEEVPGMVIHKHSLDNIKDGAITPERKRGFAALTPEHRKLIAAAGGRAVPAHKRSFSIDADLAANAGRKGGLISHGGGRPKKD